MFWFKKVKKSKGSKYSCSFASERFAFWKKKHMMKFKEKILKPHHILVLLEVKNFTNKIIYKFSSV